MTIDFLTLPDEMVCTVLSYLDYENLITGRLVCRRFQRLIDGEYLNNRYAIFEKVNTYHVLLKSVANRYEEGMLKWERYFVYQLTSNIINPLARMLPILNRGQEEQDPFLETIAKIARDMAGFFSLRQSCNEEVKCQFKFKRNDFETARCIYEAMKFAILEKARSGDIRWVYEEIENKPIHTWTVWNKYPLRPTNFPILQWEKENRLIRFWLVQRSCKSL